MQFVLITQGIKNPSWHCALWGLRWVEETKLFRKMQERRERSEFIEILIHYQETNKNKRIWACALIASENSAISWMTEWSFNHKPVFLMDPPKTASLPSILNPHIEPWLIWVTGTESSFVFPNSCIAGEKFWSWMQKGFCTLRFSVWQSSYEGMFSEQAAQRSSFQKPRCDCESSLSCVFNQTAA